MVFDAVHVTLGWSEIIDGITVHFGTDSLGGQCRWFTSPTQKTVDGRHRRVEWL